MSFTPAQNASLFASKSLHTMSVCKLRAGPGVTSSHVPFPTSGSLWLHRQTKRLRLYMSLSARREDGARRNCALLGKNGTRCIFHEALDAVLLMLASTAVSFGRQGAEQWVHGIVIEIRIPRVNKSPQAFTWGGASFIIVLRRLSVRELLLIILRNFLT